MSVLRWEKACHCLCVVDMSVLRWEKACHCVLLLI